MQETEFLKTHDALVELSSAIKTFCEIHDPHIIVVVAGPVLAIDLATLSLRIDKALFSALETDNR